MHKVQKNNGIELVGLTIISGDSNVNANVYIDQLVEEYGDDIDVIVDKVIEIAESHKVEQNFDSTIVTDFLSAKERIYFTVVNADANAERLENLPHTNMIDLSLIYKIKVDGVGDGLASVTITNQIMEMWGKSVEDIHSVAMENTPQLFPYHYEDIASVLREMMGLEADAILPDMGAPLFNVLNNTEKTFGASAMFYPGLLKEISKGNNLVILPSSIHEVLILDYKDDTDLETLANMVCEVNETQVATDEVLADHYYIYHSESNTLLYVDEEVTL